MDRGAAEPTATAKAAAREALEELRFHWEGAYIIGCDDERGWWAARRDRIGSYFTAPGPDELHEAIRADYTAAPVPRGVEGDP